MHKKQTLHFLFLLYALAGFAQQPGKAGQVITLKEGSVSLSAQAWRYKSGNDLRGADPKLNDSAWAFLSPEFYTDSVRPGTFSGMGWFRFSFTIDTTLVNQPLSFVLEQQGASEIFLNGMLLHRFGTVGTDAASESAELPQDRPVAFAVSRRGPHVLAVRYSNFSPETSYDSNGQKRAGFSLRVTKYDEHLDSFITFSLTYMNIISFATCLFLVIALMHLMLYLFYKAKKQNFYFFLFTFAIALAFGSVLGGSLTNSPSAGSFFNLGKVLFMPVIFFTLHLLVYSFFRNKLPRILLISGALALLGILFLWIAPGLSMLVILLLLAPLVSFDMIRNVIIAVRKKLPGAWIIGIGFGLFVLFFIILSVLLLVVIIGQSNVKVSPDDTTGVLLIVLFSVGVFSIPASMSIYLARDFSQTNRSLEHKLAEVEKLSAQTIEQEKEKQRILENQNIVLEEQVNARTAEISEQKKIIEEKNKDITDSITYARRIQQAMLPSNEFIHRLFPDAFVLFRPKDIVSGDFYWFGTKNEIAFAILGDCTGHGVPGALMSMIGHNMLDQLILEKGITDPGKILSGLHEGVRSALKQQGSSDTRDGMDIAVTAFDRKNGTLTFAGANRPCWFIGADNTMQELKGTKHAIGGLQNDAAPVFENHALPATQVKAVYLTSDGYADQFGGENGKKFMTKNLKALLERHSHENAQTQLMVLANNLDAWKMNREQVDDVCVIGIRL